MNKLTDDLKQALLEKVGARMGWPIIGQSSFGLKSGVTTIKCLSKLTLRASTFKKYLYLGGRQRRCVF